MAKKILGQLLDQSGTVEGTTDESKPNSVMDYVLNSTGPLDRLGSNLNQVREGFQGDSDYDQNLGYSVNQNKLRARNQPVTDQLANAAAKTIPGIGLGILENAGYLAELLSNDQDYNNTLTEITRNSRDWIENKLPVYKENPDQVFDVKDPAWWINHGQGLVESVGEFLVTGAGVGGALSKGAKAFTTAIKGGELAAKLGQGAAQLGTASGLAYTEGAMSGAQIYKDVFAATGDIDKASKAAAETVRLNTIINTGLNITSLSPIFKSFKNLDDGIKSQISRKAKESTGDYIKRLTALESQGIPQASIIKKLALEAGQEGLEEDVNLFAESEGRVTGGLKKATSSSGIERFFDNALTEEGALNFALGAVGGVAQTAGMEYLPLKSYTDEQGNKQRVSAHTLEGKEKVEYQKLTLQQLKSDLLFLQANQKALSEAVEKGDEVAANQAKQNLFNIAALKSMRTETVDELSTEIASLAGVDNTTVRENGKTDAQNQGLADNIDDNKYKEIAARKATNLKLLNKEYRDLLAHTEKPFVASEIFRHRLNVYSANAVVEDLTKQEIEQEANLTKLLPIDVLALAKYRTEVDAYDAAIAYQKEKGNIAKADLLESESKIVRSLYSEAIKTDPQLESKVTANLSLLQPLSQTQANKLVQGQVVQDYKKIYTDALTNPDQIEKELNKDIKEMSAKKEAADKARADEAKKVKQEADYKEAQAKAQVEKDKVLIASKEKELTEKDFEGETGPQGKVSTLGQQKEELKGQVVDEEDTEKTDNVIEEVQENTEVQETLGVDQLSNLTPVDDVYTQPTEKEKAEQTKLINTDLDQENNLKTTTYGDHNKLAYKAQEQDRQGKTIDPFTISELYKILHDSKFNEGVDITLKVDTESEYYEENKDSIEKVPIGVYYKGKLVGFLPVYKGQQKDLLLARNYIIKNGEVQDKISRKSYGTLNTGTKDLVSNNYAFTPKFLIGRNQNFEIGLDQIYKGGLVNTQSPLSGIVHTLNDTTNGKEMALPIDINKVSEEHVDSFMRVLNLYFKGERENAKAILTEEERTLIKDLQEIYNFDPSTPAGLKYYFDLFFYGTNLNDQTEEGKVNIEIIQKDLKRNNHYIQISGRGIRFLQSGGVVEDYGRNDVQDQDKTARLIKHLNNAFYRADITKINRKQEFKAPILNQKDLKYKDYTKPTYNDHLAMVTSTNVIVVRLSETKQTALVQPVIHLGFNFMQTPTKEKLNFTSETGEKSVSLSSNPSPKLDTLDEYSAEEFESKPEDLTEAERQEYKDNCAS